MNRVRNGDIFSAMDACYSQLTKSAKKVADYVFDNRVETQFLSITSLADECGVAEATIFRFCKMLGFSGYNDFKLALAKSSGGAPVSETEAMGKILPEDSIVDMSKKLCAAGAAALAQTLELVEEETVKKAVTILRDARRVFCFGQGGSMVIAMELVARFLTVSNAFCCMEDNHQQAMAASLMEAGDVVVFFSYSGATKDMPDVLRPARARGAKIIVVTRFAKSPAAAFANITLLCGSKESPLQSGSVAAKMAQLFLIDILYHEYCRRDPEAAARNSEVTADAIAAKLL